jgi:hypothetical protein
MDRWLEKTLIALPIGGQTAQDHTGDDDGKSR